MANPEKRELEQRTNDLLEKLRGWNVEEEYLNLYEITFNALTQGIEETEELQGGEYDWGSAAEKLRLEKQNEERMGVLGFSWGDLQLIYLHQTSEVNGPDPNVGLVVSLSVGPTGRGLDNIARVFPGAGRIGIDLSRSNTSEAALQLRATGHNVDEFVFDPSDSENVTQLKDLVEALRSTGDTLIINGEISKVLSHMPEESVDRLVAQAFYQHLVNRPPFWWSEEQMGQPFPTVDVVGRTISRILRTGAKAIITDFLLGGENGWKVGPARNDIDTKEWEEIAKLDRLYRLGDGTPRNPGVFDLAWLRRGASIINTAEDLADLVARSTGLFLLPESVIEWDSGVVAVNHPNGIVGACMMPTIANGAQRARMLHEQVLKQVPQEQEELRGQLQGAITGMRQGEIWLREKGTEYLERVMLNPDVVVNMPQYAGVTFVKP